MVSVSNMTKPKLCVIIPMYNEEAGAKRCVDAMMAIIQPLPEVALLVVNDGSTDKTQKILDHLSQTYTQRFFVIQHKKNGGYGLGRQTGIREAHKRGYLFGLFMDSDLTNNPAYIRDFLALANESIDCVTASRYIPGGRVINVPLYRQYISRLGNLVARNMFRIGVHDCTNGFRMVRLDLLKDIKFKEHGFPIILEELYYLKKKGARFKEFSYTLTARVDKPSNFRYNVATFWNYLKYAFLAVFVSYQNRNLNDAQPN